MLRMQAGNLEQRRHHGRNQLVRHGPVYSIDSVRKASVRCSVGLTLPGKTLVEVNVRDVVKYVDENRNSVVDVSIRQVNS